MKRLVLASTSPQRREILRRLGLDFEAVAPDFVETLQPGASPDAEALRLARGKALSIAANFSDALILGCDTLIDFEGRILGKPEDARDAAQMLRNFSGKTHRVLTGMALYDTAGETFHEALSVAQLRMRLYSEAEIEAYLATGEPLGKAGSYAVQGKGKSLIAEILGSEDTVIGLNALDLQRLLQEVAKA